jgi:very-short-patch-repair endonuclease
MKWHQAGDAFLNPYVSGELRCESKIEQILADELRGHAEKWGYRVIAQYELGGFRYDFAIESTRSGKIVALVECDGQEFHSSHEQKIRDAEKTKLAKSSGFTMFRFTGKEICANADKLAEEIIFRVWPR